MQEIPAEGMCAHEEDELELDNSGEALKIVVCMSRESSQRLLDAQYLQSDIGFKRVIGFHEFELGGLDWESCTSTPSYITRAFLLNTNHCSTQVSPTVVYTSIDRRR